MIRHKEIMKHYLHKSIFSTVVQILNSDLRSKPSIAIPLNKHEQDLSPKPIIGLRSRYLPLGQLLLQQFHFEKKRTRNSGRLNWLLGSEMLHPYWKENYCRLRTSGGFGEDLVAAEVEREEMIPWASPILPIHKMGSLPRMVSLT